jgi:hypothetical protein
MNADPSQPDDAMLVAWLDGELPAADAAAVAAAADQDPSLGRRVAILRAARAELAWALGAAEVPPTAPPDARTNRRSTRWRRLGAFALAAAAIAIVAVIATTERTPDAPVARNAWLEAKLVPVQPAWPLFSGIHFTLVGKALTDTPCRIVARTEHETDEQLADRVAAEPDGARALPLVLDAEIVGPDNWPRTGRVARVGGTFSRQEAELVVELVDVQQPTVGITPVVNVALEPGGPREDFAWGLQRVGSIQLGGNHGFVPQAPGAYRIRFVLRGVTAPGDARWPHFGEPLSLATGFHVRGVVGEWSAPVDGLRARIVANTARPTASEPLVVAVQVRNESDRSREYNVTGTTIAKIPQPFHFDLMVDGEQWQQRERLGVITHAWSLALPQPVLSERTLVVLADYWRRAGSPPSALRGAHRVGFRFHSEASAWLASDTALWQGKIDTPPIEVDFGGR